MKRKSILFAAMCAGFSIACSNSNSGGVGESEISDGYANESYESNPNGTYTYSEENFETRITVSGSRWTGSTTLYGDTEYDNGVVKGNSIYDESGMVEIGYINGDALSTSLGGKRVTLRK